MLLLFSGAALAATFAWGHYVEDQFWSIPTSVCFIAVLLGSVIG